MDHVTRFSTPIFCYQHSTWATYLVYTVDRIGFANFLIFARIITCKVRNLRVRVVNDYSDTESV